MAEGSFEGQLTFLAYRVTAKLTLIANRLFRQYGLDIYSSRILLLLLDTGDRAVGDLVETMALPQSTISHQLLRLEKQGFIERQRTSHDNRVVHARLTDNGRVVAAAVQEFSRQVNREMVESLDPVERLVLPNALRKLLLTLEKEIPVASSRSVKDFVAQIERQTR